MAQTALYAHAGSGNHGCEAIVRASRDILGIPVTLYSAAPEEDSAYGLDTVLPVEAAGGVMRPHSLKHAYFKLRGVFGGRDAQYRHCYHRLIEGEALWNLSIGGDIYCYPHGWLDWINRMLAERGRKTVLWGCSIEPPALADADLAESLRGYRCIIARETLTYNALQEAGLTQAALHPDPAFLLRAEEPDGKYTPGAIGVNISPLSIRRERTRGMTMKNYAALLQHLLRETDREIWLIPHVVWQHDDDRKPLAALYSQFRESGRVRLVPDMSCTQLKGVIARCALFVGARTHAAIAAYASGVPVLAVGYSVKARGIAADLFGMADGLVCPVQSLTQETDLTAAYCRVAERAEDLRAALAARLPAIREEAAEAGAVVRRLIAAGG